MTQPTPDREREALLEWLGDQRSHVLGVLKGLSEEKLRQPVLPSGGRAWPWCGTWPSTTSGSGSAQSRRARHWI
jgi:hypothetical protein